MSRLGEKILEKTLKYTIIVYMLKQFRTQHLKRILWVLLIIIVPSFTLWGVSSFLRAKKEGFYLSIDGRDLRLSEFTKYINTALVFYRFTLGEQFHSKVNQSLLEAKAVEIIALLWKAEQDNIKVEDKEIVAALRRFFSVNGQFDKELYLRFAEIGLRMSPRVLEEHMRKILLTDKVLDKYVRNIEIRDEEIKELYRKENEEACYSNLGITCSNQCVSRKLYN